MNKNLSFCGMMTAVSAVLALLINVLPFNTIFLLILMSLIVCITVQRSGVGYALCTATATALILAFVAGRPDTAIVYALVFGTYPAVKYVIETRVKSVKLGDILKIVYYVLVSAAYTALVFLVLGDIKEGLEKIHGLVPYVLPVVCVVAMWVYDWVLTRVIWFFNKRFGRYFL